MKALAKMRLKSLRNRLFYANFILLKIAGAKGVFLTPVFAEILTLFLSFIFLRKVFKGLDKIS